MKRRDRDVHVRNEKQGEEKEEGEEAWVHGSQNSAENSSERGSGEAVGETEESWSVVEKAVIFVAQKYALPEFAKATDLQYVGIVTPVCM